MKIRFLIIIGIVVTVGATISLGASLMSGNEEQQRRELNQRYLVTDTRGHCGEKYLEVGNGECELNPEFIEPNTMIIYDVTEKSGSRMSLAPHDIVMDLREGNTITFVNDSLNTVNIFDNSKGLWSFENVKPSYQRELAINETGHYKVLVQNSREGESGEIVALSEKTNSLPVEIRAKMAQTIVGSDFRKNVGLLSVGSGGAEPGITIGIHEKFQDDPNAEQFYYEKYKNMIPFDVPIWIEFHAPAVALTG